MPFQNEHSARLKDPDEFIQDSFRRQNIEDGIDIIIGMLIGEDKMTNQSYRFKIDNFTEKKAKDWLKDHEIDYILFEPAISDEVELKIYGDIGESDEMGLIFGLPENKISAKLVSEFLDENKEASKIIVRINSRGGDVQEGWGIYDLLTTSGKKIKTIGESKIYSIATIIFLAGEEREIMKNADGLIHNPFIPPYTLADKYESDDLTKIAEMLEQEEEKILNFYAEKTGTDKEKLREYMKDETMLSAEDMVNLGFATKIVEPIKALAYFKLKNKSVMNEKEVKTFGEKLDAIIAKISNFSRLPATNRTIKDVDGKEITLEKESGDPAVGDKASPDGTFTLENGKKITISDGKVTEVSEPVSELKAAQDKIKELEAKISEMETVSAEAKAEKEEAETAIADAAKSKEEAEKIISELKALKNSWKPENRSRGFSVDKVGDINVAQVRENMKQKKETLKIK